MRAAGGQVYAGELDLKFAKVPWTVWHGTTNAPEMKAHERTDAFIKARIRLTTVDKVHWSLLRERDESFLRGLRALVLDEAHFWQGLSGANVRGMLDRLRLSLDVMGVRHPAFFLASATLNNPTEFAESLTGCGKDSFLAVDDQGATKPHLIPSSQIPRDLETPSKELRRYVLMLSPDPEPVAAASVLGDRRLIGLKCDAVCFVQSKFVGHRLRDRLEHDARGRQAFAYDADMTAGERRALERAFLDGQAAGRTVVATSALELGVDLPSLDVAVVDEVPPRRSDLIQRIGRVGRRTERPGLAVLCLGLSPIDERLTMDPQQALSMDGVRALPLPLGLDSVRLRMMKAAFQEWEWRLNRGRALRSHFNEALLKYFGERLTSEELDERVERELGDLIDLDEGSWYYHGFRATASQGRKPLILRSTGEWVAQVEDTAVFRDAHPEAVYLGHRGQRFRVVGYRGRLVQAEWTHPESAVRIGKFMKVLHAIEVEEEKARVATRGRWKDRFELYEQKPMPPDAVPPKEGALEFGIWTFLRRFDGYVQVDLTGAASPKLVSLGEVSGRFKEALAAGKSFPYLHNFSYRTLGWRWKLARVLPEVDLTRLGPVLAGVLQAYGCDAVECAANDLQVVVEPGTAELRVVDGTPGGNGLAALLLTDARFVTALEEAERALRQYGDQGGIHFARFMAEECRIESQIRPEEVWPVVDRLARAWRGKPDGITPQRSEGLDQRGRGARPVDR
jgi:hypothetical protein